MTKKNLNAMKELISINFDEHVWCSINLKNKDKLLIGNIYRSPNSDNDNNIKLQHLLTDALKRSFTHTLITGDFNFKEINWNNWSTSVTERHPAYGFLETTKDLFLNQHVQLHTRYREGQTANCLDLIFTNEEGMVDEVVHLPGLGHSDHLLLTFNLNLYSDTAIKTTLKKNYFKGNYDDIKEELRNKDWHTLLEGKGAEESWKAFAEFVSIIVDKNVPVSKGNYDHPKQSAPLDKLARENIKDKHKKWLRYQHCRTTENWNKYKLARNKATSSIRVSKYHFERNIANHIKDNPKQFWKYIRSKTKTRQSVGELEDSCGKRWSDSKDKANVFNEYFSSVFKVEPDEDLPTFTTRNFNSALENVIITKEKIQLAILKLNPNKSSGPDIFHPKLILETSDELIEPLEIILKKSIEEGTLPSDWKVAHVTPIHKNGSRLKTDYLSSNKSNVDTMQNSSTNSER
ncbi:uncharacterized protein [Argopecten irradians]|uniref:uncharacterized protein n=1 Tax=Argopecten irradians TaxID=31199 RepID=UPI00371A85F5